MQMTLSVVDDNSTPQEYSRQNVFVQKFFQSQSLIFHLFLITEPRTSTPVKTFLLLFITKPHDANAFAVSQQPLPLISHTW